MIVFYYQNMSDKFIDSVIENIQCPICYLAMLPPHHVPMIIPGCGHTICESCLSRIHECPLCHQTIANPTKNIFAIQIIDSMNQNKLIPPELSPPAPSDNKLLPKIDPICTFAATGEKFITQNWYQCRTCKISGNYGFCEICAKKCHNGHDVYLRSSNASFFCDCPSTHKCKCLVNKQNLRCTYDLTYGYPVEQPMYQCEDCHIIDDFFICQNCAIKCHKGHKLHFIGILKNKVCHCFDHCFCQITPRKPFCTYVLTGKNFTKQPKFCCKTCGLVGSCGCCSVCAIYCHKGHDVQFHCYSGLNGNPLFFCDCGDGFNGVKCKILNTQNRSYLNSCPNFGVDNKDKKVRQRKYHCLSCGVFGSLGICEACAINCHINHPIEYFGIDAFCCTCKSTENCQMMMAPLLHNDRNCCDRKVLNKDDVSACYTCYTCDKSGKIQICETCVFKKHSGHDIHIIGYNKFECHG